MHKFYLSLFLLIQLVQSFSQTSTVNYTYSTLDFVNPERGFYRYTETTSSNYTLLDSATLAGYRNLHLPTSSANYNVYSSLIFRYFVLENFKTSNISATYLNNMTTDFNTIRKAGVKVIPRFVYTIVPNSGSCGSWICPPYGDASKARVLAHIAQIKPILQANKDVIAAVQMGFIGTWGEQYYTDFFGDASQPPYSLTPTNWNDRRQVLDSLLSAVPNDLCVQVRYPQMKQKDIYGVSAPTTSAPLTLAEAYTGSNKSRIGFHNDCFLANYDDYGTYANYDNGNSDTLNLKPYKDLDAKYVMVGGETCNPSAFSTCDSQGGNAIEDMDRMNYTYLNAQYNTSVNNTWQTDNCMNEIKLKLGYRLFLKQGIYTNSVSPGGTFTYNINLENNGFSAPVNKRRVELVLINQANNERWVVLTTHDPRFWFKGVHNISGSICLPACIQPGSYKLYINLNDPSPSLASKPEYSIRLANTNIWNSTTGYNDLNHTLTITSGTSTCSASRKFERLNDNIWIGASNISWYASTANWSMGRFPDSCDDVLIPENKIVNLSSSIGYGRTLLLKTGARVNLTGTGLLKIEQL
ncbi:MAG: hypothetical protein RLZZ546_3358 [Bacteroidota bacterium]